MSFQPRSFDRADNGFRPDSKDSSSGARSFRAAGSNDGPGRPATTIDQGRASRALVAARRYRNQQENKPEGGAMGPNRRSIMAPGELNAIRARQRDDYRARYRLNLAPD